MFASLNLLLFYKLPAYFAASEFPICNVMKLFKSNYSDQVPMVNKQLSQMFEIFFAVKRIF